MRVITVLFVLLALIGNLEAQDRTSHTDAQDEKAAVSDATAASVMERAAAAQNGNIHLRDVTLTGTVVTHFGQDRQGTITLLADFGGRSKVIFNLDSGQRTEYSSGHAEDPACTWTDGNGKVHDVAMHNCWTDGAWFFPLLSLPDIHRHQQASLTHKGAEERNDSSVEHLVSVRAVPSSNRKQSQRTTAMLKSLATQHLYIDSKTALPTALTFNTHPDDDAGSNIPIEIRFSDYRQVNGVMVPFHIEKLINGSTILEITVESASFNTGVPVL